MEPQHSPRSAREAVIFDLDGVVTDTASLHALAWKALFDEQLPLLSAGAVAPFDAGADYRRYVDGRPREDGIRAFLSSRGLRPEPRRIAALAARKQALFEALIAGGVQGYPGTVALVRRLRGHGIPTAIVTSSRNCAAVLAAAGLTGLFDVRVDGTDAARLGLPGKPDPALFLEAARQLRVSPGHAVVIEDAESGVRAASTGGFGLVIGVDRTGYGDRLRAEGADLVVADLGELDLRDLDLVQPNLDGAAVGFPDLQPGPAAEFPGWAGGESGSDPWLLRYVGFDPVTEGLREAICTLGNGYWGTRGAAAEADADGVHYPGTYFAGVYNRVHTRLGERTVEDEHLVNGPNWLPLWFRVADNDWFRPGGAQLISYVQELDLRRGVLRRDIRFRDEAGRTTRVTSDRFVSQSAPRLAVLTTTFEAEDWSGPITVRSALEGRVSNRNVAADRLLTGTHLVPRTAAAIDEETVLLEVETSQSGIHLAMAARTRAHRSGDRIPLARRLLGDGAGWVAHEFEVDLAPGHPVTVEKTVIVGTSRDRAIASPARAAATWMRRLPETERLAAAHERAWQILWDEFAVRMHTSDRASLALNLNTFHVLQTLAAVDADLDAGMPARGLHGEGYRGHVFWDELFVYPILTLRRPDLSRALLGYRYRRLGEARAAAKDAGFEGAMFPWQSGIDGREVTPTEIFNTRSGRWMPDNSHLQRHVGLALAYSVWQHYQATGDTEFLIRQGAEILLEVARFFASLARYDEAADRYDIEGVMGPDEFHDGYPGSPGSGLRNNAYTNVMTAWVLRRAVETVSLLEGRYCRPLWNRLRLRPEEVGRWQQIGLRLRVPFHADGVISQFDGYEDLAEFDWQGYAERYGSIARLDLILAAEGDSPNNYRVSKQADVLMLLYLLSAEELRELLQEMGYALPPEAIVRTVEFYGARSTHGSTLSNVVHSWLEARRDRERSWEFLTLALESDLGDIQGGSTHEGIHLGAMAGSVDMVVRCYTGLEFREDMLWLHPALPAELARVVFTINYREQPIRLEVTATTLRLRLHAGGATPIRVRVEGRESLLAPGETRDFALGAPPSPAR
ncbi:beta-phosphoglucomutase family hydrolase [Cryobacterium tagatosivorans]|uniref:Beta-phosphoglucomutase family hydrolase n=1 Tax=Cryobacterium tagatosivorans TaxID=1259199 RepID=A0A4R8UIS7_9MICO|nr:beta-phosphoglucomutase family hydrolase [Cryobacterium tagatosivorans]